MNTHRNPSSRVRQPTHPGAILREDVLPELGIGITEAARRLHISRQTLHALTSERKGVTPEMALRIGKLAGNGPRLWLRMQQDYDLWFAERKMKEELRSIDNAAA